MKRLLALLLCLAMAVSLCACNSAPGSSSSGAASSPVEEGPSPMDLALEAYQGALDKLDATENLTVDWVIDQTTLIYDTEYTEHSQLSVDYAGLGSDNLRVHSSGTTAWGDHEVYRSETYADGQMSGCIDYSFYTGPTDEETFLSLYPDLQLIDAGLYGSVEQSEDGTLTFTAPSAGEIWAVGDCPVEDARGSVTLDETGAITACSYTASYHYGNLKREITVSGTITPADTPADIALSSDSADYPTVTHPATILLVERSMGMLRQAKEVSLSDTTSYTSEAASFFTQLQTAINYTTAYEDLLAKVDISQFISYFDGSTDSYTQSEVYRDGKCTITANGHTDEDDVTAQQVLNYCDNHRDNFLDCLSILSVIEDSTLTMLGDLCAVQYTMDKEFFGQYYCDSTVEYIFGDKAYLDQYASDYRTDVLTGYIGIDLVTGLPTVYTLGYVGYHTIDGTEYALSTEICTTCFAGGNSVYETVTETLPETDAESPSPLFYHVTGSNGEEMWLMGTIHVGDSRTTVLPGEIYAAFDASDALAVEFDDSAFLSRLESNPELALQMAELYYYTDGTTLADHVSDPELAKYAKDYCRAAGLYITAMDSMKASLWSNSIDLFHLQRSYSLSPSYGVDTQLLARAEEQGKQILDVESAELQLEMISGYSDEIQEMLLAASLSQTSLSYGAGVSELYEAWCAGNEADLIALLNAPEADLTQEELALYEEYNNAMVTQRNEAMLQAALDYLAGGDTVFYAVGLGHLISENGLVNTLRDAGYTVELVEYAQ